MEIENKYASRAIGNAGLTTGIIGTALGVLNNGGLGNLLGGMGGCSENQAVTRYEMGMQQEISAKDSKIALLESSIYVDGKLNDLRNYVDGKFVAVNEKLCAQAVHNATSDAVLGCMQGQIGQLMSLTKMVVPNASVCPGWGDVTITPAAAPAAGA